MTVIGPSLTRWNSPAKPCPGCAGCSIRRQLEDRDTFTRAEVAHLLALAFRSGSSLAYEMAGDVVFWAEQPFIRRTARQQYEARLADIDASAASQRERDETARLKRDADDAERIRREIEHGPMTPAEWLADVVRRQGRGSLSGCEWPEVAVPGGAEAR